MMNKAEQKIRECAEQIRKQAVEMLFDIESDVLPYVEQDTIGNAKIQAEQIVRNILEGRFEWDGDNWIVIQDMREMTPRIRIAFTAADYDALRDRIIERMPVCPKDAKIRALEDQLRRAHDRMF